MADNPKPIIIAGITGRNNADSPLSLAENTVVEAFNVDFYKSSLGRRRGGSTAVSTSGGTAFVSGIGALISFIPSAVQSLRELWAVDRGFGHIKRLAAGVWSDVTPIDIVTVDPYNVNG